MGKLDEMIGKRVSNVVVLRKAQGYCCICLCDCGKETKVQGHTLINSYANSRGMSCGCIKKKLIAKAKTDHGMTLSREFASWSSMKNRCLEKTHKSYADYGGRGISICDSWLESFNNFYKDMGPRPPRHSISRIDNNGNYEPSNCIWETAKQQSRNRRTSRFITAFGKTLVLAEWSDISGIPRDTLSSRLETWSIERALLTPVAKRKNSRIVKCKH